MSNYKTVRINEHNWKRLKEMGKYSLNNNLKLLMDSVEEHMPLSKDNEIIKNLSIHKDVIDRLDGFHLTLNESRDNIISRMFIIYDELHSEHEYTSFKLTCTYNENLIITGRVGLNSRAISFTDDGERYYDKLHMEYIYQNQNLSKQFQAWVNILNFDKIVHIIIDHYDSKIQISNQDYILYVNYEI